MIRPVSVLATFASALIAIPTAQAATCFGFCSSTATGISQLGPGVYAYVSNNGTTLPQAGRLPGLGNPAIASNPTNGSEFITDGFAASAGQVISFTVNYGAAGSGPPSYGFAQVGRYDVRSATFFGETTLFGATDSPSGDVTSIFQGTPSIFQPAAVSPLLVITPDNSRSTGWLNISYTAPTSATYALRFGGAAFSSGSTVTDRFSVGFSNLTLGGATIGNGSSANSPLLPNSSDPATGGSNFTFNTVPGTMTFIDPLVATGYDYVVSSGPNILSALFPELGDANGYQIYALNGGVLGSLLGTVMGGSTFNFGPGGVSAFALRDINTALGLDPANPTAFVTGLTFASAGRVNISQTPVTTFVPGSGGAVPEPATWLSMLLGLGLVGGAMRSRQKTTVRFAV